MECSVNLWLAGVILTSAVLTKILHNVSKALAIWLASAVVRETAQCSTLRRQALSLKEQMESVEEAELEDRVRIFNSLKQVKEQLKKEEKVTQKTVKSVQTGLSRALFVVVELSRVAVIFSNRLTPVFMAPPLLLWPLSGVLSFPTGVTGAVSSPVWGLACRHVIDLISGMWTKKFRKTNNKK